MRRSPSTSPDTWCPTPAIGPPRRTLTTSAACSSSSTPQPEPESRVGRTIDTPKALLRCAEGDACSEASSRPYGTLRAAHASSDRRAQDLPLPHWVLPYLPAGWPRLLAPAQARTLLGLPFLVTVWSAHDIVAEDPRVMRPALTRLHGQKKQIEALTDHANRSRDFARDAHDLLRIEMRLPAGAVKAFWYLQQELPNDRCDCGGEPRCQTRRSRMPTADLSGNRFGAASHRCARRRRLKSPIW